MYPFPDVESIERATLDAVCPAEVNEFPGWLLPYDPLPVGRAQSAVPLAHTPLSVPELRQIEAHYQQSGRATVFRLPEGLISAEAASALHTMGYTGAHGVLVQVAELAGLLRLAPLDAATLSAAPSAQWASVYTAYGFDPVDGAHRVQLLSRSRHVVYAHVSEGGQALAAGTGSISHGWLSIHGMRTAPSAQGRGLASRILAGLAAHAAAQGVHRVFLQVEDDNTVAQGLYRKAGFVTAWQYHYWRAVKHAPRAQDELRRC
ncbi:MAG: GNAT family N-acetyltransferase [Rhodoferax sp.]|nr:GNAT family N-acetyltransferase [Rhodoferax sp.]